MEELHFLHSMEVILGIEIQEQLLFKSVGVKFCVNNFSLSYFYALLQRGFLTVGFEHRSNENFSLTEQVNHGLESSQELVKINIRNSQDISLIRK